jgi:S-adenosylmethionine-diacylgycerolhomoserine-N-methlytransferase
MSLWSDFRVIKSLVMKPNSKLNKKAWLNEFYLNQAQHYDSFREGLLHGRAQFFNAIPIENGKTWLDLGGGTGRNLEFVEGRLSQLQKITIVDLCEPLLEIARARIEKRKWRNVEVVCENILDFSPPEKYDIITFSYSLSMIPEWKEALSKAQTLLRENGTLHVIDFYVSDNESFLKHHSSWTRYFWPLWFGVDKVRLDSELPSFLIDQYRTELFEEDLGSVPYLRALGPVPHFRFHGRRNAISETVFNGLYL